MGSCFTENLGSKLDYFKFQNLQNPFGVLFHPLAIENLVHRAIHEIPFEEKDIFWSDDQWHCLEVHSLMGHSDKQVFLQSLNEKLKEFRDYLSTATHIVFTYGTSWVYREISSTRVVANCHKLPEKLFSKELLSVEEISKSIGKSIDIIRSKNSLATIIFTVSPVRHIKDGFVENTRSKAQLFAGLQKLQDSLGKIDYFPSYEIMMDELRDYRFYAEDMLHPNATAISIIWERFQHAWISSTTEVIQQEIDSIQKGLQHKPFNLESTAYQNFKRALQQKIESLKIKYPSINL